MLQKHFFPKMFSCLLFTKHLPWKQNVFEKVRNFSETNFVCSKSYTWMQTELNYFVEYFCNVLGFPFAGAFSLFGPFHTTQYLPRKNRQISGTLNLCFFSLHCVKFFQKCSLHLLMSNLHCFFHLFVFLFHLF